jgi:hypothetical protein
VLRLRSRLFFFISLSLCASAFGWADDKVTRVYMLKNVEVSNMTRVINIAVRDMSKTRIIGGNGKRLVISDTPEQQDTIAQLLPVLDQPLTETDPDKIQMRMLVNVAAYLRQQKVASKTSSDSGSAPQTGANNPPSAAGAPASAGGAKTYDTFKGATPYKSIYASDDAEILKKQRVISDDPALPSLSSLQLRGIFRVGTGSPLALMFYEGHNYTARDGGLFENNHIRVKNVTSQVFKDRVVLVGQDHIPREIKFKTTL